MLEIGTEPAKRQARRLWLSKTERRELASVMRGTSELDSRNRLCLTGPTHPRTLACGSTHRHAVAATVSNT